MELLMLLVLCGSGLKGLGLEGTVVFSLPLAFLEASAPVHNPVLVSGYSTRNKTTEITKRQWLSLYGRYGRQNT